MTENDEREALLSVIINAPESGDALHVAEARRVADAVIAAGFHRSDWQWGVRDDAPTSFFGDIFQYGTEAIAREVRDSSKDFTLIRRRKAGEWEDAS